MVSNMKPLDLKLLVIFDAIMSERSVTLAARRLGMSQPAVSNALTRLREVLKDPLFVRTEGGMTPTPRALDLTGPLSDALKRIEEAVSARSFRPDEATEAYTLSVSNQAQMVVVPLLLERLSRLAPLIRLRLLPKWNTTIEEQLDSGVIDFAIGIIPDLAKRFDRVTLFQDRYVCVMGNQNRLAGREISANEFLSAEHIAIRPYLDQPSQIDLTLRRMGGPRRTILNVSQFSAVPSILRRTNLLACLLTSVAEQLDLSGCHTSSLPFKNAPLDIVAAWSAGHAHDQAAAWMRAQLEASCEELRQRQQTALLV